MSALTCSILAEEAFSVGRKFFACGATFHFAKSLLILRDSALAVPGLGGGRNARNYNKVQKLFLLF